MIAHVVRPDVGYMYLESPRRSEGLSKSLHSAWGGRSPSGVLEPHQCSLWLVHIVVCLPGIAKLRVDRLVAYWTLTNVLSSYASLFQPQRTVYFLATVGAQRQRPVNQECILTCTPAGQSVSTIPPSPHMKTSAAIVSLSQPNNPSRIPLGAAPLRPFSI